MMGTIIDDRVPTRDARILRLTFGFVLIANLACSLYASIDARGLYHDGVYYLIKIADIKEFFVPGPARATIEALRQTPVVLLSKFTEMSLFQLGQVFSFTLLILPTVLCALCWLVAPPDRKVWTLFPLTYLLVGGAPTSIHAIGEAAPAASYFWILLFLLVFRTHHIASQLLFLLLFIPAFRLHEGCFPVMLVLLLACSMRMRLSNDVQERVFLALSAILIAAVIIYEISWILYPQFPEDRDDIAQALVKFEFLYVDGHLNAPLVTGMSALLALATTSIVNATAPRGAAKVFTWTIVIAWVLFAFTAATATLVIERTFAPLAQLQARYHPVFVSAALGMVMVLMLRFRIRAWMQPTTAFIIIALCGAQTVADVAGTLRWHAFKIDLQSRLTKAHGLIPWEATLHTNDKRADVNWHLMAAPWVIPITSVVFSMNGVINSLVDLPTDMVEPDRPINPKQPDLLPKLPGVDYSPYRQFFVAQKSGTLP
ncbi:hypothetical protein Q2941_27960 [Bradyrhizobium sp. UFLA05-153]